MRIIALLVVAFLTGCASMTPENKDRVGQTGSFLLQKALSIAVNSIVENAQSPRDGSAKANWMDSLAKGIRVTDQDITQLVGIWTPKRSHWAELGVSLERLYESTKGMPPEQRREIIAVALNEAAAKARAL